MTSTNKHQSFTVSQSKNKKRTIQKNCSQMEDWNSPHIMPV